MKTFGQTLIEGLISEPRTAQQLAMDLRLDRQAVVEALAEMKLAGVVATGFGVAPGDAVCVSCEETYADVEIGERCTAWWGDYDLKCGGLLADVCLYSYCGGPVSQALAVSAQEVVQL